VVTPFVNQRPLRPHRRREQHRAFVRARQSAEAAGDDLVAAGELEGEALLLWGNALRERGELDAAAARLAEAAAVLETAAPDVLAEGPPRQSGLAQAAWGAGCPQRSTASRSRWALTGLPT
jgi:hypothetical protein